MLKTAVFISGRGSNFQAILKKCQEKELSIDLDLVLSNKSEAAGLKTAADAGIATSVVSHRDFKKREEFDRAMDKILTERGIELIVLAGFMRLLSPWFVKKWKGKIINIHPSLLPSFPGLDTHQAALDYGVKFHGCSVIFVNEGVDTGAIIEQAVVPVLAGDDADTLAARVLKEEHKIFPKAVEMLATGKVRLENGKAVFED